MTSIHLAHSVLILSCASYILGWPRACGMWFNVQQLPRWIYHPRPLHAILFTLLSRYAMRGSWIELEIFSLTSLSSYFELNLTFTLGSWSVPYRCPHANIALFAFAGRFASVRMRPAPAVAFWAGLVRKGTRAALAPVEAASAPSSTHAVALLFHSPASAVRLASIPPPSSPPPPLAHFVG